MTGKNSTAVTSPQNPRLKYVRRLAGRRFREREGKFLVEGSLLVEEALLSRWPLELLVFTEEWKKSSPGRKILALAKRAAVPLLEVAAGIFAELAGTQSPQGVLAVARRREENFPALVRRKPALLVLVDAVQDPGNLGTIIRCADAAGAGGVLVTKGTVDPYNPKTVRGTMGSLFHLPVLALAETAEALQEVAGAGLQLVVGDPGAKTPLFACDFTRPTLIAVGNERRGCAPEILAQADKIVCIPMPGRANSLNVAAAAAIMLYEAVRQRCLRQK